VLTCAHVVRDAADLVAEFPNRVDVENRRARVEFSGPYDPADGRGDLAVLALDTDVAIAPARFARPWALRQRPEAKLVSYGFPGFGYGYDNGLLVEVRALSGSRILGERNQLVSWEGYGMPLVAGFSGAAVRFADTEEVVGIVVSADRERGAEMLPVDRIVAYWPQLAPLLPLGPFDLAASDGLRSLLAAVELPNPALLFAELLPGRQWTDLAQPRPRTAVDLVRALTELTYVDGDAGIRRAVAALTARLTADVPGLAQWRDHHVPDEPAPAPAPAPAPLGDAAERASVIVEIAPSASERGAYLLNVWRMVGNDLTCPHRLTVVNRDLRRTVERVVPDVVDSIDRTDLPLRVEFVLPRRWLTKPVHTWTAQADGERSFGHKHALVLRDYARFTRRQPDLDLRRRWELLRGQATPPDLRWVDCTDVRDRQRLLGWLARDREATTVALQGPPAQPDKHAALGAAFASNVPVVLWGGQACPNNGACPQPCAGVRWRAAVTAELANCPAGELPERLLGLRLAALESGEDTHCGHGVVLLWDDPTSPPKNGPLGLAG
jgi:hypothetical protein